MRTLYLLRHAKSSWKNDVWSEFERRLAGRGRKASETIGRFLKEKEITFDLVLCSPAVRARETTDLVLRSAKLRADVRYDERIYEATPGRLIDVISQIENEYKAVVLVGHNPGMAELLQVVTGQTEEFPTATLAKIVFKNSKWTEVATRKGTLEWVVRPRGLDKS